MKRFLRCFTLVVAAALILNGCRKKEPEVDVAEEAEAALPPGEQVPPTVAEAPTAPANPPSAELAALAEDQRLATGGAPNSGEFEAWFKKNNLDLNDSAMLDADPDGDGSSNRDEFLADTNPHEPGSRPGIHKTIRLKEFSEVRLPLVLESVEGSTARIRRTDATGKAESVRAGDSVSGLPLKVAKVQHLMDTDKGGNPLDRSTVILEDTGSKERVTLVKNMPARTAASFAVLTSADGASSVKVKEGDTFKWPGEDAATYKVIDLREDQVVLQQLENKKMWTIARASKTAEETPAP
ncbi:MAG TPA: Amuc_1099 family pilus-like system protein [Chthoniobacteraceae bacterium]|jgi:hypothetical protein